jgi:hypothetical protein
MKSSNPLLSALAASALLFGGMVLTQDVLAQDAPPASASSTMAPAAQAAPAASQTSATTQTPQGQVTINSSPAPAPTIGPAPSFEQLSGGGKSISEDQAVAYPPLANDFLNADSNRNGSISKSEYARWVKQLQ